MRRHRKLLAEKSSMSNGGCSFITQPSTLPRAETVPGLCLPPLPQGQATALPLSLNQDSHDLKELWLKQLSLQKNISGG